MKRDTCCVSDCEDIGREAAEKCTDRHRILRISGLAPPEKTPLNPLFTAGLDLSPDPVYHNQLKSSD